MTEQERYYLTEDDILDLWLEANEIADEAFGDDRHVATQRLGLYVRAVMGCGCGQCIGEYVDVKNEIREEWEKPDREMNL